MQEQPRGPIAKCPAGFTLVEVLVALAIVAITLVAGIKASAALNRNTQRQATLLLAQLCAENSLVGVRLRRQLPPVGVSDSPCKQGRYHLQLKQTVEVTPNPNFRRVEASVWQDGRRVAQVNTIAGRN